MFKTRKILALLLVILLTFTNITFSETVYNENSIDIQAVETSEGNKYPDYAKMYLGEDVHENFNRKMFSLNSKLNKYIARPIHIVWSSIMPKFGMDRMRDVYNNIEYPKRLVSSIIQRDGRAVKDETIRFLTNSTLGIGGLFDPADKIFKVKPTNENMEQALCKCKVNSGTYFVMPCVNSCTPRSLCGRVLEAALDPAVYLASPIVSIVKAGLMVNRTSYMQPLAKLIETTYADPYDIHKKLFGMENYIKNKNFDRQELLLEEKRLTEEGDSEDAEKLIANIGDEPANAENITTGYASDIDTKSLKDILPLGESAIKADITLEGFNSQTPVVDSMRTAFFDNPNVNKSIWNEISLWNRSFARRIKSDSVSVTDGKPEYLFKYLLQKDKNAPLMIIFPSIGEGAGAHHSQVFAKYFYDEGYSVLMLGSHFQWEFIKSMPDGYCPGLPLEDSEKIKEVTSKILSKLETKYDCKFNNKTVFGTSFGAMSTLFLANSESKNNTLNIKNFIAVSPPIELKYAIEQVDKNAEEFDRNSDEVKDKTAIAAAKVLQLLQIKDDKNFKVGKLPFSDAEGKLITTFIMRQKLSDLILAIENVQLNKKSDIYERINNMSYRDYAENYLGLNNWETNNILRNEASLFAIRDYLANNNNYKIYHSLDDYFVSKKQIAELKSISGEKLICLNCGSHLGFLYRKEFTDSLINSIKIN